MSRPLMLVGENQAVRQFLQAYSSTPTISVQAVRSHMTNSGYPLWPDWAATFNGHLTKAGAQEWLRHLFALENQQ